MRPPLPELQEEISAAYASFPDAAARDFARQVRSAATEDALGRLSAYVVRQTPGAMRRLRETVGVRLDELLANSEQVEQELARIREAREIVEEFQVRREHVLRQTCELLRSHFPESQLSPKALEFAYRVPVPTGDHDKAQRHSDETQFLLFQECLELARQLFDAQQAETIRLLDAVHQVTGGRLSTAAWREFRPPEFSPIRFSAETDTYEQVRSASLGLNLARNVRPRWVRGALEKVEKASGIPTGHLTALAGYESLARRTRNALRRELAGIAAEQMRRVYWAALTQVESCQASIRLGILEQSRGYFSAGNRALSNRLLELARERRKTAAYAASAERALLRADTSARRVLAVLAERERTPNQSKAETFPNGLSTVN